MSSAQAIAVNDLNTEARWPAFGPFVLEAGFSAVAGVPVRFQRQILGAVNLYGCATRSWTNEDLAPGQLVADLATGYLVNSFMRRDAQSVAAQLQQALQSRVAIEQAKGILAGRHGIDPEVCFVVLRGYARGNRIKLQDLASGDWPGVWAADRYPMPRWPTLAAAHKGREYRRQHCASGAT